MSNQQYKNEKNSKEWFGKGLRNGYKNFEEHLRIRRKTERSEYSDIEKELSRKYEELFGDDE